MPCTDVDSMTMRCHLDRVKRIWYLSPMRAAKVQASLRIRAVSPEPSLLAHTSSESRGTFRQKSRSLAPLNGWECAVKSCHDGMLEDTNSLDGAHLLPVHEPRHEKTYLSSYATNYEIKTQTGLLTFKSPACSPSNASSVEFRYYIWGRGGGVNNKNPY